MDFVMSPMWQYVRKVTKLAHLCNSVFVNLEALYYKRSICIGALPVIT